MAGLLQCSWPLCILCKHIARLDISDHPTHIHLSICILIHDRLSFNCPPLSYDCLVVSHDCLPKVSVDMLGVCFLILVVFCKCLVVYHSVS